MIVRWVLDVDNKRFSTYAENRLGAARNFRAAGWLGWPQSRPVDLVDEPVFVIDDQWNRKKAK